MSLHFPATKLSLASLLLLASMLLVTSPMLLISLIVVAWPSVTVVLAAAAVVPAVTCVPAVIVLFALLVSLHRRVWLLLAFRRLPVVLLVLMLVAPYFCWLPCGCWHPSCGRRALCSYVFTVLNSCIFLCGSAPCCLLFLSFLLLRVFILFAGVLVAAVAPASDVVLDDPDFITAVVSLRTIL